jgi:hypothetical protein
LGAPRPRDDETAALEAKVAQERRVLTEAQLAALERVPRDKEAHGECESECPGYCGAQDTFSVGTLEGVGRIYRQTFIDTQGRWCYGKTPLHTFVDAVPLAKDKEVA